MRGYSQIVHFISCRDFFKYTRKDKKKMFDIVRKYCSTRLCGGGKNFAHRKHPLLDNDNKMLLS